MSETGIITTWFADRGRAGYGFVETRAGVSIWFGRENFIGNPEHIRVGASVEFVIESYKTKKGKEKTRAVDIKIIPTQTIHEVLSVIDPDAKPYVPPVRPNLTVLAEETTRGPQQNFTF